VIREAAIDVPPLVARHGASGCRPRSAAQRRAALVATEAIEHARPPKAELLQARRC
jgi:hypothetical protein